MAAGQFPGLEDEGSEESCQDLLAFYEFCRQNKEPMSRLDPLTCSSYECAVRGCLSFAEDCKTCITRRFLVPSIAHYCRAMRAG